jgi:hypothetical protein
MFTTCVLLVWRLGMPHHHHHHHHHHRVAIKELGHLLTYSGLMYPESTSVVCLLGCSFLGMSEFSNSAGQLHLRQVVMQLNPSWVQVFLLLAIVIAICKLQYVTYCYYFFCHGRNLNSLDITSNICTVTTTLILDWRNSFIQNLLCVDLSLLHISHGCYNGSVVTAIILKSKTKI